MSSNNDQAQIDWAKTILPTYRNVRRQGPSHLDAFLYGLFVAYTGRFWHLLCARLGVPNLVDTTALKYWKRGAFVMLSELLLRVHLSEPMTQAQSSTSRSLMVPPDKSTRSMHWRRHNKDVLKKADVARSVYRSPARVESETPPVKMEVDKGVFVGNIRKNHALDQMTTEGTTGEITARFCSWNRIHLRHTLRKKILLPGATVHLYKLEASTSWQWKEVVLGEGQGVRNQCESSHQGATNRKCIGWFGWSRQPGEMHRGYEDATWHWSMHPNIFVQPGYIQGEPKKFQEIRGDVSRTGTSLISSSPREDQRNRVALAVPILSWIISHTTHPLTSSKHSRMGEENNPVDLEPAVGMIRKPARRGRCRGCWRWWAWINGGSSRPISAAFHPTRPPGQPGHVQKGKRASAQQRTQQQPEPSLDPTVQALPFSIAYTSHSISRPSCPGAIPHAERRVAKPLRICSRDMPAACSKGISKLSSYSVHLSKNKTTSGIVLKFVFTWRRDLSDNERRTW
ncbi:hypothetical protein ARMGADRAFT_1146891 [Armillaria gallica]|uniref:Uncharacterized protein n=1 Tax=Armillaria gallica TaxID=47427 RepID=A0A2H3CD55_ARMGA|nr:hypothetical protein ARMGADRAFT_1146891 [Armillaria gallica]